MSRLITRRALIGGLAAGAGGMLSGCDALGESESFRDILFSAERLNQGLHRAVTDRGALAREYDAADMSPVFRANGTRMPAGADYQAHLANRFADWRLIVDGLVARPLSLSLTDIGAMPTRTQITRHDCVEGWSAIGKWHGVPLKRVLDAAGLRDAARYIVFHCADTYGATPYYESVDLIDAFHPQTILAWGMNDRMLPVAHGAPLRLRVERQLGYKHAKYVMRVQAVDSLGGIGQGKGGFWEDGHLYEWYAGI
jgi:DMSO/TMAO reductase YedYZ molybdopterin-dependent catalytic subunit